MQLEASGGKKGVCPCTCLCIYSIFTWIVTRPCDWDIKCDIITDISKKMETRQFGTR